MPNPRRQESPPIPEAEQAPELAVVAHDSTSETTGQANYLAVELSDYLDHHPAAEDYRRDRSPTAKAALAPFKAYTFIQGKIERMPRHLRRPHIVPFGTLDSVLHRYNEEFTPGATVSSSLRRAREEYLDYYGEVAALSRWHPEISGTLLLVTHAAELGRLDVRGASRTLLAAYGRSLEIVSRSGRGAIWAPSETNTTET